MERIFILGAGFSHWLSNGKFCLASQLGQNFIDSGGLDSTVLLSTYFRRSFDILGQLDLEWILSQIDLDLLRDDEALLLRKEKKKIYDFLCIDLSIKKVKKENLRDQKEYCKKLFKENDKIITFNYDCLLEHILWEQKRWHYEGGYGKNIKPIACSNPKNPKNIIILKPHGSLSFSLSKSGYLLPLFKNQSEKDLTFLDHNDQKKFQGEFSDIDFILPSYIKPFKGRTLRYMFHEAASIISKANKIKVIGYSLPEADTMAQILLSYIGHGRRDDMLEKNIITQQDRSSDAEKEYVEKNPVDVTILTSTKKDSEKVKSKIFEKSLLYENEKKNIKLCDVSQYHELVKGEIGDGFIF